MVKANSLLNVLTNSLQNFYAQEGFARDLTLYKGHSQLSKTFVKLYAMSNNDKR